MLFRWNKNCVKLCPKIYKKKIKLNPIDSLKSQLFSNRCPFLSHSFETKNYHCWGALWICIYCTMSLPITIIHTHELLIADAASWLVVVGVEGVCDHQMGAGEVLAFKDAPIQMPESTILAHFNTTHPSYNSNSGDLILCTWKQGIKFSDIK